VAGCHSHSCLIPDIGDMAGAGVDGDDKAGVEAAAGRNSSVGIASGGGAAGKGVVGWLGCIDGISNGVVMALKPHS